MHTLPSSEFRKRFASLTEVTIVTVNGHPIGEWLPRLAVSEVLTIGPTRNGVTTYKFPDRQPEAAMQEFRPVPKPGRK